jgi:hypothetical protein
MAQLKGAIKEPVLTLSDGRKINADSTKYYKINLQTGEWATREKKGASEPVRIEMVAARKAVEPREWFDFAGITKPGTVGATSQYPGVFLIVDRGNAEYGCFPEGELILTTEGVKPIETIGRGEYLLGENSLSQVRETFQRPADQIIEFDMRGFQHLRVTPNHPIFATKIPSEKERKIGKKYQKLQDLQFEGKWYLAEELMKGDYIAIPKIREEREISLALHSRMNGKEDRLIKVDKELAYVLGQFVGDGYSADEMQAQFSFSISNRTHLDTIRDFFTSQNIRTSVDEKKGKTQVWWVLNGTSASWCKMFRENFYSPVDNKKMIPLSFLHLERSVLRNFLKGYYDADGRKQSSQGQLELGTTSPHISRVLPLLLMKLGVCPGGSKLRGYGDRGYTFIWMKKYLNLLDSEPESEPGFRFKTNYLEDDDYFFLRIRKRDTLPYSGTVFNLQTSDNTIHTPLKTHNSQKSWMHEYFFDGKVLKNGRYLFRQLKAWSTKKSDDEPAKQKILGSEGLWDHMKELNEEAILVLKSRGLSDEQIQEWIEPQLTKIMKEMDLSKEEIQKAFVIPPGKEEGLGPEVGWLFINPDDQVPYVLSARAIEQKFIPPNTASALPKHWRVHVKDDEEYWVSCNESVALERRKNLVERLKEEGVIGRAEKGDRNPFKESVEKARHRHDQCMECSKPPDLEIVWAEGVGHAWFCWPCFIKWLGDDEANPWSRKGSDVDTVKLVKDGEASKKFSDNHNPVITEQVREFIESKGAEGTVGEFKAFIAWLTVQKAAISEFHLTYQFWKGQKVVREGASRSRFLLWIKDGKKYLIFWLNDNILDADKTGGMFLTDDWGEAEYATTGYVKPGSPLNPTKNTPSFVRLLDSGKAIVLIDEPELKKIQFDAEKLKGVFLFKKAEDHWYVERVEGGPVKEAHSGR